MNLLMILIIVNKRVFFFTEWLLWRIRRPTFTRPIMVYHVSIWGRVVFGKSAYFRHQHFHPHILVWSSQLFLVVFLFADHQTSSSPFVVHTSVSASEITIAVIAIRFIDVSSLSIGYHILVITAASKCQRRCRLYLHVHNQNQYCRHLHHRRPSLRFPLAIVAVIGIITTASMYWPLQRLYLHARYQILHLVSSSLLSSFSFILHWLSLSVPLPLWSSTSRPPSTSPSQWTPRRCHPASWP